MCGIAGLLTSNQFSDQGLNLVKAMIGRLSHRGPDGQGFWSNGGFCFLGHARLAIQDLSEAGDQPMLSPDGRFIIVFNGEVYNHFKVRTELESKFGPISWRGQSDTETVLMSFSLIGIAESLKIFKGMFVFALFDQFTGSLHLGRDHFGEKPLFYGYNKGVLFFASELKAIKGIVSLSKDIASFESFLAKGFLSGNRTIYHNFRQLLKSSWVTFTEKDLDAEIFPEIVIYEPLGEIDFNLDHFCEDDLLDSLDVILARSVKSKLISDVEVGAFLSGGIDSSLVVKYMSDFTEKLKTFSIGFAKEKFNELNFAKEVSKKFNTDHTELVLSNTDLSVAAEQAFSIWDEPLADSSILPTLVLAKLTSESVSVALTGDGADELFLGYPQYFIFHKLQRIRDYGLSQPLSVLARCCSIFYRGSRHNFNRKLLIYSDLISGSKIDSLNDRWKTRDDLDLYNKLIYDNSKIEKLGNFESIVDRMSRLDFDEYLTDDLLVKVDRGSMAFGLETRAPFLDVDLANFAANLNVKYKLNDGHGKYLLKKLLSKNFSEDFVFREKKGFQIPLDDLIRKELHGWLRHAVNLIPDDDDLVDVRKINLAVKLHSEGVVNVGEQLFKIAQYGLYRFG